MSVKIIETDTRDPYRRGTGSTPDGHSGWLYLMASTIAVGKNFSLVLNPLFPKWDNVLPSYDKSYLVAAAIDLSPSNYCCRS